MKLSGSYNIHLYLKTQQTPQSTTPSEGTGKGGVDAAIFTCVAYLHDLCTCKDKPGYEANIYCDLHGS